LFNGNRADASRLPSSSPMEPTDTPRVTAPVPPTHRMGVRVVDGSRQLFDRATGKQSPS
jgi:hypothetical protein